MNDDFESLEAELAGLVPVSPSSQLRGRIAEHMIAARRVRSENGWKIPLAVTSAIAVAASLLVMLLPPISTSFPVPANRFVGSDVHTFDLASPSVWAYHRALNGSADALDNLLNRHAATQSNTEPPSHVTAFRSFPSVKHSTLGDL